MIKYPRARAGVLGAKGVQEAAIYLCQQLLFRLKAGFHQYVDGKGWLNADHGCPAGRAHLGTGIHFNASLLYPFSKIEEQVAEWLLCRGASVYPRLNTCHMHLPDGSKAELSIRKLAEAYGFQRSEEVKRELELQHERLCKFSSQLYSQYKVRATATPFQVDYLKVRICCMFKLLGL
eukprot:1151889-Pelagomonas_calceolata.AAC.4